MLELIWGVIIAFIQVGIFGGLPLLALKYYEWYDDRLVDRKIGGWIGQQKFETVELVVPPNTSFSISEMQAFFNESVVISGNRGVAEIYSTGAAFFDMAFEIIGHDGKFNIYLTLEKARLELLIGFLKSYYPTLGIFPCKHPFEDWPSEWIEGEGLNGLTGFRGADIVPAKTDLHPLKDWTKFYNNGVLISDPMNILINTMKSMPKDGYLIFQYAFRPHPDAQNGKTGSWEKELGALRKEFLTNNVVERVAGGIQSLTREEEDILQNAQVKLKSNQYRTKLRWAVIYDPKGSVNQGNIKKSIGAYLQELSTSVQSLKDSGGTNTIKEYSGGSFGPFDSLLGGWINKVYWGKSEKYHRVQRLYKTLIGHSLGSGDDPFFLDPGSIASMLHFPQIKQQEQNNSNSINYQNPGYQSGLVIQQYQPSFFVQQDGTRVPANQFMPGQGINQPVMSYSNQNQAYLNNNQVPQLVQVENYEPPDNLPT